MKKNIPVVNASNVKLLTMKEAMEFLNERGYPCKSRSTFYRILKDFKIPYNDTNPCGKNRIRRFPSSALEAFIKLKVEGVEQQAN